MKTLLRYYPILVLLLFVAIIAAFNFTPSTFLSGWDTLHPEFNFPLNLQREIFGVFRPDMGLGTLDGHSTISDLPHSIILWLLSNALPIRLLRYSYMWLCLLCGSLGMYFLLIYLTRHKLTSLIGAIFYLCNLGTLQQFIVPFEMFTTQYATLPWIFLFTFKFLEESKIKYLVFFALSIFLSTPMAFAATLWYVFAISFFLCFTIYLTFNKSLQKLKNTALLFLAFLAMNCFWLLPNLYFIFTHGSHVAKAYENLLFSQQAFFYNKTFGNLWDIARMKTFYFNWNAYAGSFKFQPLLASWNSYIQSVPLQIIEGILAAVSIVGVGVSIKSIRVAVTFLPMLIISLFFLFNANPPLGAFYTYLSSHLPLFQEAFRFPQDKVLGLYTFCFAIFFSFGFLGTLNVLQNLLLKNKLSNYFTLNALPFTLSLSFIFLVIVSVFPMFKGNLISPYLRVNIPQSYFSLFKWFDNHPTGSIATFPMDNPFGWVYHNWNNKTSFQGSGFVWYAIPNSMLNRDFDRWNIYNEASYREISYGLYSQDPILFKKALEKFNIKYLLIDKSIINPSVRSDKLFVPDLEKIAKINGLKKVASFGNNLEIYEVGPVQDIISTTDSLPVVLPNTNYFYQDIAYSILGNYQETNNPQISFPFSSLVDSQGQLVNPLLLQSNKSWLANLPTSQSEYFPAFDSSFSPSFKNTLLTLTGQSSKDSQQDNTGRFIVNACPSANGTATRVNLGRSILYKAGNSEYCDSFSFPYANHKESFILSFTSKHIAGLPLTICVRSILTSHCSVYATTNSNQTLQLFLIPPIFDHGFGYEIAIQNLGIKGTPSINKISTPALIPFPYFFLTHISQNYTLLPKDNSFKKAVFTKINPVEYRVKPPGKTIVLSESFDPGWVAYQVTPFQDLKSKIQNLFFPFFFGKEINNHFLVNNWENGWKLSSNIQNPTSTIIVLYLPQYLEYLGFIILIIYSIGIIISLRT